MIPGDIDSVTRAYCCAAHWRSLVDHTSCCSSRRPDSGSAGVSALEGEYRDVTSDVYDRKNVHTDEKNVHTDECVYASSERPIYV